MKLEIDLLRHSPITAWMPSVGDVIHRDGVFSRWCAVVIGINGDKISVWKAGNPALMVSGESKEIVMNARKIKSASLGVYYVVSEGTYYV